MTSLPDRDLVASCLRGEEAGWEALGRQYGELIRQAARHRLKSILGVSTSDVDEVSQRVLVKLSAKGGRALSLYDPRLALGPWLTAVSFREATDYVRGERRIQAREVQGALPDEVPSPFLDLIRREEGVRLEEAMSRLPGRDQLLLRMVYWDGLPAPEVARALGVSSHSVSTLARRARERLREILENPVAKGHPAA